MQKVVEVINKLRELSGNSAIEYLKENKDTPYLRDVLYYAYNPDYKYGIKEDKYNKANKVDGTLNLSDEMLIKSFINELDRLAGGKSAKDKDVLAIKTFIENSQYADLLRGILFKDLRIGMDVKTFNKVWNDFYFKYPYLGAKPFNMKNLQRVKFPAFGQLKADGLFCNIIVDPLNKKVEYVSRQGKPVNIYGSLESDLLKVNAPAKFVLTGEILVYDKNTNKPYPREISNGIVRRDVKTEEELSSIKTMVWDFVPYDDFIKAKCEMPYEKRFAILKNIVKLSNEDRIIPIESYEVNSIEEAMSLFEKMYERGEEGIVVKEKDLIWEDKKPKGCVKIKMEKDCDLRAVGFEEGSGAYSGMCGTINCISEDNLLKVGIKPRTPAQAKEIWENQEKYLNKILAVRYNEKIQRKDTQAWSLFLPRYVEWRDLDKTAADKLEDIE